jgi:hypothetical protein
MAPVPLDADALEAVWRQARVWARVRVPRRDSMHACWIAPAGRVRRAFDDEPSTLVRVVYEQVFGTIPPDQSVQRSCATPTCCNPAHLMLCRTRRWAKPGKRKVA